MYTQFMTEIQITEQPIKSSSPELNSINEPTLSTPPTKKSKSLLFFISLVTAAFAGIIALLTIQNHQLKRELQQTNVASPNPSASTSPNSDWQTYTNVKQSLSFNYPNRWELTETPGDEVNGRIINQNVTLSRGPASISMNLNMDGIGGVGRDYEGTAMVIDGNNVYRYTMNRDNGTTLVGITDRLQQSLGVINVNNKTYSLSLVYPTNEKDSTYESDFDQILSTFKFAYQTSITNQSSFSGDLQSYLQKYCIKGNPYTIELSKLPIKLDSKIITPAPRADGSYAFCSSMMPDSLTKAYISVNLIDNTNLNIYDQSSEEGGHGGSPFIGMFGDEIYQKNNVLVGAYFNFSEGPSLVGKLGIELRGQKEFVTKSGEKYYVNINITGIPSNDTRLVSSLQPFSKIIEGFDEPSINLTPGQATTIIKSFFDQVKNGTPEATALAKMNQILGGISPN